ncbi:MAG: TlyA family RNA methyltransferase [Sulfurospirillum sp.]|nr:MAG: TlyA family RNA methyltransferase [Sulfurospirillum sp.]
MRLDHFLFKNSYTQSRNRAKELIKSGFVLVNNKKITKPSFSVNEDATIKILSEYEFVSRAGKKLRSYLDSHPILIKNRVCLDIGSSTGGFIEVLLEEGAKRVDGVDVGKDQLHPKIRASSRVRSFEECDIREFKSELSYDLITCDVSFVGVSYILESIDRLSLDDILILFKPQFEVGKEIKRDKRGVVRDNLAIKEAQSAFLKSVEKYGWRLNHFEESKIRGKEGNIEIFYHFKKNSN